MTSPIVINNASQSDVVALTDGSYVVAWNDTIGALQNSLYFQRFSADGTALTSPTLVSSNRANPTYKLCLMVVSSSSRQVRTVA